MSSILATFEIIGRVGKVGKFGDVRKVSLAVDDNYKDKNGEWVDRARWNEVDVFDKFLVTKADQLQTGDLVLASGHFFKDEYESKGSTVYTVKFVTTVLRRLHKKAAKPERDHDTINDKI